MVSGLLAAVAAFLTALFAVVAPGDQPTDPGTAQDRSELRQSLHSEIEALRAQIVDMARAAASANDDAEAPASGSLIPQIDIPEVPSTVDATDAADDGCERESQSGEGWASTLVRCISTSTEGGSVSVSSSSSVTVQRTNSDDAP